MKKLIFGSLAALIGCAGADKIEQSSWQRPQMTTSEVSSRVFTPEVMLKMGRLGGVTPAPNGSDILYTVNFQDVESNSSRTNLYLMPEGNYAEAKMLTTGKYSDNTPTWSSDGKSVYFISNREGGSQLWQVDVNSGKLKKITSVEGGINGYQISPNQTSIWYTTQVKVDQTAKDKHSDMDKANAMIYDDLMARHWDYWLDGTYSHIFVAEFDGVSIQNATNIMEGEPWDAPLAPYFDSSEISWSNDGKLLAYACKKLTGLEYAESTNSDIYLYNMADKTTSNITEGMVGYDLYPLFSPDDKQLAWVSMERMSNESDKERLFVVDLESGKKSYLTKEFDYNASSLVWDSNSSLYFIAPMQATHQICKVEVKEGAEVEVLTEGLHDYNSILKYGDKLLATKTTLSMASEIFSVDPSSGDETQISYINKDIYDNVDMAKVEKRWVKTTDGKEMLVWVILPPNFDENKKYPTLLYCQGGPQSVVSQFWSYRWNFQLMAAQGYVVVAPNRRGLPSFGSEWLDQISGDYSGQNIKDYLSAIDAVSKEKWVDSDRRACVGASYGGYSTFFLAGNHEKRFKTFIAHCGMFNMESFYYGTEELWFPNNDLKGAPHSDDPIAKRSYANSPHKFVKNWDSPILIFSGLKDYRIPYSENLQAFTAARTMGLEARLVAFEDEGHQVFKPQNAMIWHREFYEWLDKYLK